jgi:hypothetical protein
MMEPSIRMSSVNARRGGGYGASVSEHLRQYKIRSKLSSVIWSKIRKKKNMRREVTDM